MKTTPLRCDFCPASLALAAAAFGAFLIASFPTHAASWEGADDFSSGISPINWAVHQANAGQMTVEGANGHSSFLVPPSTTALQNAYLVWYGTPTAAEDWMVEITGHNAAGYSLNGDSQLQLAVYHTTSIGYRIAMVVEKAAGGSLMFNVKHRISGGDTLRAQIARPSGISDMRLVYRAASGILEAWYDPGAVGTGWTQLDAIRLADFSPTMTSSDPFTIAILGNTYYGPITEGQLWADNFRLTSLTPLFLTRFFDPFTNSISWNPPTNLAPDSSLIVTNDHLNYTCTSTAGADGAFITRKWPLLPTTQDWSMKIDVHLDLFTLTTPDQFSDLFLGFGKTGDEVNTHVMYEFGRILWGSRNGYYIGDDVRINGVQVQPLFNVWNINIASPMSALRLYFNSTSQTLSFYWDADAGAGGYNWLLQRTMDLASGTYDLNLSPTNTLTILLAAASEFQTVGPDQAYFDDLEVTIIPPAPPFTWITNNGTITITGYTGPGGAVTIPSQITSLPVTSIAYLAFYGRTSLTSVSIPGSVTSIGFDAFALCTSLTNVTMADGIISIGPQAFYQCTSLTSVIIPDTVTSIDRSAFIYCSRLTEIIVGGLNPVYSSHSGVLFDKGQTALLICPAGKAGSYTVPTTVTNIGDHAFFTCSKLTGISIPATVSRVGYCAFNDCTSLNAIAVDTLNPMYSSVVGVLFNKNQTMLINYPPAKAGTDFAIPDSVTAISDYAFAGSTLLTNVSLPSSLASIGIWAFDRCSSLTAVTIPDSVTYIGQVAYYGCTSLVSAVISANVTSLEPWVFAGCTSLTNITIPASVTSIWDYALADCSDLTEVHFQGNAPNAGLNVFEGADNATVYYLPCTTGWGPTFAGRPTVLLLAPPVPFNYETNNGTLTITGYTGAGGPVAIPDRIDCLPVTSIGQEAFADADTITSVVVPNSVLSISDYAFISCTSLTNVTLPGSITNIGIGVFGWCPNLMDIMVDPLNSRFRSVDGVLFSKDYTLIVQCPGGRAGTYSIPGSITTIGDGAFFACGSLTNLTIPQNVTSVGSWAFFECTSLASINLPNSVASIGDYAFSSCTSLTSVTIPASVTKIGDQAFLNCSGLSGVYCWGNAPTNGTDVFDGAGSATVFYLPGTTGWGPTYADRPTAPWVLPYPVILGNSSYFGIQTNAFGFLISWATNVPVIVDASPTITSPIWSPVSTNTLVNGTSYFTDPNWTNYPARFYRVRSP